MKIKFVKTFQVAAFAALFLLPDILQGWGFWAHKTITRKAISAMPEPVSGFFQTNADSLAEKSIDPDLWRRHDQKESNRHFIDIDEYGAFPYNELPRDYDAAVAKFGEERVLKAGIAPWRIMEMLDSLSHAMKKLDQKHIIRYATALAHYVEDIHMPLHTVTNYDGQFSGNKGIHSRYERWMLEAHKEQAIERIKPGDPQVIPDVLNTVFEWVLDSNIWADNLLLADTRSKLSGKSYDSREDFDAAYYDALHKNTRPFTGMQMSRAATAVASCWL
ncbi:MAG: S1/P1 nuclease, partial [bacterium]